MTLMSVWHLPCLCMSYPFSIFPGLMEEWGFFYLSQSGVTHSLSWWCRNTARMEKSHKQKWNGFVVFSCLDMWLFFFTVGRQMLFEKIWSSRERKKIYWSSNFTPVCRCSAEISHIQVIHTEIIEVLWHIWDAWMPLCQDCAHNSEQLAACKGSRKTTVAIFTWWGLGGGFASFRELQQQQQNFYEKSFIWLNHSRSCNE